MRKSYLTILGLSASIIVLTSGVKETKNSGGKTGATSGCSCHSGTNTGTVSLSGIPSTVLKSSVNTFSILYNPGVSTAKWGLNVKCNVGTLAVGTSTGVKKVGTELTHIGPITSAGTSFTYANMQWTAPATASAATISFACLAADGDGGNGGDVQAAGTFSTSVVLPVELTAFNVSKQNNLVNISWQTATEINTNHFEIEKSNDGKEFISVAKITAAGSTSDVKNYSTSDKLENAKAIIYYRLKIVDKNGDIAYSKVQSINVKTSTNITSIYPNPAKKGERINIEINSEKAQTIDFALLTIDGKILSSKQKSVGQGFNKVDLLFNNFVPTGNYYLQAKVGNVLLSPINISIIE